MLRRRDKQEEVMKKRYFVPLLAMAFLVISAVQVHAQANTVKSESVTQSGDERYNEEYYGEPTLRFAVGQKRSLTRAAGQSLEEYIVAALENMEPTIDVSAYNLPVAEVEEFFKILNNNPQLFYVKGQFQYSYIGDIVKSYTVSYLDGLTKDDLTRMRQELEAAVTEAVSQVDDSLDDYQQALVIHDYLVQNCEYDYENYQNNRVPELSHTMYGSLVNKTAVCDGYADAFCYIMRDKLGISCEVVSSSAMAHAWNMIEIGGSWYHVDATWDDPAWDCIGRVGHSYFLLSDSKISNNSPNAPSGNNHFSWSKNHTAVSSYYDNAFWSGVNSAICYFNGAWYYSQYQKEESDITKAVKLLKKKHGQLLGDSYEEVHAVSVWISDGMFYSGSFMYLSKANNNLYFNTQTEIWQVSADGSVKNLYSPQDLSGKSIYGFTVRGDEFWYAPQSEPNLSQKQMIRKLTLPVLSGITAEDVTGVYNGSPYMIEVKGLKDGDVVQYAGADGVYQSVQPQMIDAGKYEVRYKVNRDGYTAFFGKASVTIEKAEPSYEAPTGLIGYIGKNLGSVELPDGFVWQTDANIILEGKGTKKYLLKYIPQDSKNYKTVSGIEVEVEVECPGHKYASEITTPPTEDHNGVMTYTCTLCGHTYTEEIDKDLPVITGITASDVTGIYTGKSYTITINGLMDDDFVQFALQGEAFQDQQPEMINAGIYDLMYKVARDGYQPFVGSVKVEITRAVPKYTVPMNLKGSSGAALGSIELPDGFLWQSDPETKLTKIGYEKFLVCYRPADQVNYQMVIDIEVSVEIVCPGHQYECVVDKKPTETQKGQRTYTCKLCGKIYTEEISMLAPARPARASNLKLSKRTTNSLTFSWKKTAGVNYRLMFYKGANVISTKFVTGNTYTYTNLSSATIYTLRVTPYRVVNRQNVFAKDTAAVKTATTPLKAKLSTAKRKGSNKIRLTWKRVSGASGYEIFMKTGSGKYKKVKTVGKDSTLTFTKTGLSKKKSYSFRMRAYTRVDGDKIYGAYSNVKSVKKAKK